MEEVVLFAGIGPNPAPVTEAIWALHRQRSQVVVEAHLVSLARGHHFLDREFMRPGAALQQLQDCLPGVLPHAAVREHQIEGMTDSDNETAQEYRNGLWDAARAAIAAAGERPVVFLLAGGRARTTTAYTTMVYQLLARPCDQLLDVRVTDPGVEGGTGFYFPEQPQQSVLARGTGREIDARHVGINLLDVPVPRLRRLVPDDALTSFERALAVAEIVTAQVRPPSLRIDLPNGVATVDGVKLKVPRSAFVWLAVLAMHRVASGGGEGWLPVADTNGIRALLKPLHRCDWIDDIRSPALVEVIGERGGPLPDVEQEGERLKKLRTDTRARVHEFLEAPGRAGFLPWLVPATERRGAEGFQRLPLDPSFIHIVFPQS